MKLKRLSGEDLDLSSCCSSLSAKIAVSGSINLVTDISIYEKGAISSNHLDFSYIFLFLY